MFSCVFTVACIRFEFDVLIIEQSQQSSRWLQENVARSSAHHWCTHVSESLNAIHQRIANSFFFHSFCFASSFSPSSMHRDAYKLSKIKYHYTHCRKHFTYRVHTDWNWFQKPREIIQLGFVYFGIFFFLSSFSSIFHHGFHAYSTN